MNHYSVGLEDRDRVNNAFGGGFPEGSIVLVEGTDGAGKSVVAQRCAYGMVTEGTATAYVSTELRAAEFIDQMHSLSYDVVRSLLDDRLLFLHAPVDARGPGREGDRDLLGRLFGPGTLWRGEVVFVDSFGAMLRNDPSFDDATAEGDADHAMERVVRALKRAVADGRTVFLTVDPTGLDPAALGPLRGVADVYLTIETSTVGQDLRRSMVVRRFAGMANPVDDTIGFSVEQGRGITIESRTIA
jgi:flagellar protein FlaH